MPAKPAPKPKDKEAAKAARSERRAASKQKRAQLFEAFRVQRREDKALLPWMSAALLGVAGFVFGVGWLYDQQWVVLPLAIALGTLAAIMVFGRRVQKNVYSKAEGQPGAAAWA